MFVISPSHALDGFNLFESGLPVASERLIDTILHRPCINGEDAEAVHSLLDCVVTIHDLQDAIDCGFFLIYTSKCTMILG